MQCNDAPESTINVAWDRRRFSRPYISSMFGVMCTPEPVQLVGLWGVLAAWATNKQESSQELPSELTHHSARFGLPQTVCLASFCDHRS